MTAQNKSISQLNNLEEGTDNDYLLILNNGEDKKITFLNFLKNLTKGKIGLGNVRNVDTTTTANITDSTDKRFVTDDEKNKIDAFAYPTTALVTEVTDKRYVTDANLTTLGNTSGTNTGDNAVNSNYSSLVSNATHTGDAEGATTLTVKKINGVALSGLATGILKNTTTTGAPSIATGADLPVMTATVGGAVPTPPNNTTTFLRGDGTFNTPPDTGTVTAVSVATANGVSGSSSGGTTPALTIALGAITPSSIVLPTGSLYLKDLGGNYRHQHYVNETNTATRTLFWKLNNANRNITFSGDLDITANASVSGTNTGDNTVATALTGTPDITVGKVTTTGDIELGHATDTTISRSSAGVLAVEGVVIPSISSTDTLTNKTLTSPKINENVVLTSTATELNYVDGVTSSIQTQLDGKGYALQGTSQKTNGLLKNTSYYYGSAGFVISTTAGYYRTEFPRAGTIKSIYLDFYNAGAAASNEASSVYIRINNTTNYLASNNILLDAVTRFHAVTGFSIPVSAGDYYEVLLVTANWATEPTGTVVFKNVIYIE
jgi:hypothetical protein